MKAHLMTIQSKYHQKAFFGVIMLCMTLTLHFAAQAKFPAKAIYCNPFGNYVDTVIENKVDYLEKIYFSGKNKSDLNTLILQTLDELDEKPATAAVARQYLFLDGIKDKAAEAKKSCDVEELLAAGIYSLDETEAIRQSIPKPSGKVAGQLGTLLDKTLSSTQNLGNTAGEAAFDAWYLSGGKINAFSATNKAIAAARSAQKAKQLVDQFKGLSKMISQDNPCKSITPKSIEIGRHDVVTTTTAQVTVADQTVKGENLSTTTIVQKNGNITTVLITGADYSTVSTICERIRNCGIVSSAKMNFDVNGSSISVTHTGSCEDMVTQMMGACQGLFTKKNLTGMNPDERKITLKI